MKTLTPSQKKVYDFVKKAMEKGVPPTVREICAGTGLSSTSTVHTHLKTLEKLGYIDRGGGGKNRSITIAGASSYTQVPIVGTVTAGLPILAVEEVEGYIPYAGRFGNKELFALHVKGYSMKNAGILDGDLVIAEKTSVVNNGDIAVALIDDEATVKRIFYDAEGIRLQPENPDFEPIISREISLLGKVLSVVRYY